MKNRSFKKWMHQAHIPNRHSMAMHTNHLLHDSRFWAVLIFTALLLLLIIMAILFGGSGTTRPWMPVNPTYPPIL